MTRRGLCIAFACLIALVSEAQAQSDYPYKPVRIRP